MKKQMLENGKKLSKKELKTVAGGKKICMYNGICTQVGLTCIELQCQTAELKCTDIVGNCISISLDCIEPKCRFEIGIPL